MSERAVETAVMTPSSDVNNVIMTSSMLSMSQMRSEGEGTECPWECMHRKRYADSVSLCTS